MSNITETKKNYIEPAEFFRETVLSLQKDQISHRLSQILFEFATRYANHQNFNRYHHIREDLISCAMLGCVKGFKKFRPLRNKLTRNEEGEVIHKEPTYWDGSLIEYDYLTCYNPFAYFTTCARNEMIYFLKTEYNERNISNKMKIELGLEADEGYNDMIREQEKVEGADIEDVERTGDDGFDTDYEFNDDGEVEYE